MGFSSLDDFISKVSNSGQFFRADWTKQSFPVDTYTIGRWYDLTTMPGYPQQMVYGDLLTNGIIGGSEAGWTLGAGWSYLSPNSIQKVNPGAGTLAQTTMTVVAGHTYLLSYTLAVTGTGVTPSVGGTNGTARAASGTYTELIGPVASSAVLTFTPGATTDTYTITNVSCVDALYSAQLSDTMLSGAMYHGGNVAASTKHLINAGVVSAAANFVPGVWVLCDMLLAYPGIRLDITTAQALTTTLTLPRYVDGVGVRAFLQPAPIGSGSGAQNFQISYTNTTPTAGQGMPTVMANTASAIRGHISHSGVVAQNFGPFLPLSPGDRGMLSIDGIRFTGAGAASTFATLVMCKPLIWLPNTTVSVMTERDYLNSLPSMHRIVDGACLGWLFFAGAAVAASSNVYGYCDFGWA